MKSLTLSLGLALLSVCRNARSTTTTTSGPSVTDHYDDVTYHGLVRNDVELFLNIPYGQDTSGEHRFKPPRPFEPTRNSSIDARAYGPVCPQPSSLEGNFPLTLTEVTDYGVSEDCLNLNVARPGGTEAGAKLPVMVFIHGGKYFDACPGSFWTGSNAELSYAPDGLILQSVENDLPIIHVAINYRLGLFGFAFSDALKEEGSTNAGLRDQRLAIEWVRDHIDQFGGDPSKITIFGQSSGGLAVGIQTLAYGGEQPVPFQQGICESQALEPGITGDFTRNEMQLVTDKTGCNTTDLDSPETLACLRDIDTDPLLDASVAVHVVDISNNIGDSWLPAVDGEFLPDAPSKLVAEGRFATNITTMIGWTDHDVAYYTPPDIATETDTRNFVSSYLPYMTDESVDDLLALYPSDDFSDNPNANTSAQFYRSARIFRDIIMTCMPTWYGGNLARHMNNNTANIFLYDFNQTMLEPLLAANGRPDMGPVHTSEFAYVFGNISHYDLPGYPFDPTDTDRRLEREAARSWSAFASVGRPSLPDKQTLQGWESAFPGQDDRTELFVVGGASEGQSALEGPHAKPAVAAQKLGERCAFLNSPEIIAQLRF